MYSQNSLPTFIRVREIFARFAIERLFVANFSRRELSLPIRCNNNTVVVKAWSLKLVAATELSSVYSQNNFVNRSWFTVFVYINGYFHGAPILAYCNDQCENA